MKQQNKPIWLVGKSFKKGNSWPAPTIIILYLTLVLFGFINLYSAAPDMEVFFAQIKNTAVALVAFVILGWVIPIRLFSHYAYWIFGILCIALITVLLVGHTAGGAQRWLNLGFIKIQPSEMAKVITAMTVAAWVSKNHHELYKWKELLPILTLIGSIFLLIFLQPDLGTGGVCAIIGCSQLAILKIERKTVIKFLSISAVSSFIAWHFFLYEYQKLRVLNMLNPNLDPTGTGYNALQSLIAIGSGKFFGKGYLQGTQSQLQFLPERHTDFIFAVFAEEHGFWGGTIIFALFTILTYTGLEIGRRSRDTFCSLFAIGLTAFLFVEYAINIAMVLGVFPVVGMPLPYFSYGGSAQLTLSATIGLLIAIERDTLGKSKVSQKLERQAIN